MRIDIVSLFPEICSGALGESIMGRAIRKGLVDIRYVNLRDYTHDRRKTVDEVIAVGLRVKPFRPLLYNYFN